MVIMAASDNLRLPVPAHAKLSRNDVHIWWATLDQMLPRIEQMAEILSEDERIRAGRFHFERDRRRFIVGRGTLRMLLSLYLDMEPGQLEFCYGAYGKPYLDQTGHSAMKFNLAHSHEFAVYAFALGREMGVDVEYIRHMPDMAQMAASFFSPRENAVLKSLPKDQKRGAFYNCWTRKEAYIKAIGEGLSHPLDQFDVSLAPGEPAKLLKVAGDPEEASRWQLKALTPAPGYVAALAVEGRDWRLQSWQWAGGRPPEGDQTEFTSNINHGGRF